MIRSKIYINSYTWGNKCKGWPLLSTEDLSVIQEIMPRNTEEVLHKHKNAQQFFYILKGEAIFKIENTSITVTQGEGIHINVSSVHKIKNESEVDLEFLVISQPHAHGDRINIKEDENN